MKLRNLLICTVGILLAASVALAQTATGSIAGTVTDATGAVVPGVKVTITDVGKGISRAVTTDSGGRFQAPELNPGNYEVQAQMEGFQTEIRKGIELTVGLNAVINIALQVGQVAQTTVVTAEAPLVETVSGTVSGLVDSRSIRDLPLNGRSFDQLIALQSDAPQYRDRTAGVPIGASNGYSINGARVGTNSFLMDGMEVVGASASGTLPGGAIGVNMGVEAIQEFAILTSNYSAAYGKKAGGAINIATRSGTNQIHGSVFEFLRNSDLDARNFFDVQKPSFKRNQFGAAIGGPIRKDKTFFFGNYEGLRQPLGETLIATVPGAAARQGILPGVTVPVSPLVVPYLNLFPAPNGIQYPDGTAQSVNSATSVGSQDFYLVRVDQRFSDKDAVFVRYNLTNSNLTTPDPSLTQTTVNPGRDQVVTVQETRTYASFMNQIRLGYVRSLLLNGGSLSVAGSNLGFLAGQPLMGSINFGTPSQAGIPALNSIGANNKWGEHFVTNQFEYGDQAYYYHGSHSLQFGVKYQRVQHNDNNATSLFGSFQFTSLQTFLTAQPSTFQGPQEGGQGGDGSKSWRQNYFATYVQDDWKVRRNLTLNLGVRWEFLSSPSEAGGNRISNYLVTLTNGLPILNSTPDVGDPIYATNYGTVAPRVGFAWDTFGDGKMAVRGGFGIFYDQIEKDAVSNLLNTPYFTLIQVNNGPFPLGFGGAAGAAGTPAPNAFDPNGDAGTKIDYNFGIDRQITANTIFKIGYVGSHSYHLVRQSDINIAIPQILAGNVKFYPLGAPRRNAKLGSSRFRSTDASASYNALQTDLVQRLSHGLRYKLSYTFAKSIDTASGNSNADTSNNSATAQDPFNITAERGLSAFDVRHNVAANFTYDVPWQNMKSLTGKLIEGWQVGTIISVSSGVPFTAITGFNQSRDQDRTAADRPNLAPGASNNPVTGNVQQWFNPTAFTLEPAGFYGNLGRNTMTAPGFSEVDFTLVRSFSITERFKADFRAEVFNLMNHPSFGIPNLNVFNANGSYLSAAGAITTTNSSPREIQFGLKLLF